MPSTSVLRGDNQEPFSVLLGGKYPGLGYRSIVPLKQLSGILIVAVLGWQFSGSRGEKAQFRVAAMPCCAGPAGEHEEVVRTSHVPLPAYLRKHSEYWTRLLGLSTIAACKGQKADLNQIH